MKNKDFAVFILTHGRPNLLITEKTLRDCGYTGKIYFIIDDEDSSADVYFEKWGDGVVQFNKKAIADKTDEGDNFNDRRTITHARNASFEIAEKLGVKYWIQLDDDYQAFEYRLYQFGNPKKVKSLDAIFDALIDFYKSINAKSIACSQGGDWIGGKDNANVKKKLIRKCMNSFICTNDRPFKFVGRMNEDVNTYATLGSRGDLFFTVLLISIVQRQTQSQEGGITDMYLDYGTYVKAFTTVMFNPSATKIALIGTTQKRIHHNISWNNTVPKILHEKHKKEN